MTVKHNLTKVRTSKLPDSSRSCIKRFYSFRKRQPASAKLKIRTAVPLVKDAIFEVLFYFNITVFSFPAFLQKKKTL